MACLKVEVSTLSTDNETTQTGIITTDLPEADCQGTLWLLRHNHANLDTQQRQQLHRFLVHSPNCHLAYTFREELTAIFEKATTKEHAVSWLIRWEEKVKQSGLSYFDKFLTTLRNHWEYITNYFIQRITSGFVEGTNNKIQTIKRRCYGIRRLDTLFRRIWLDLQGVWHFGLTPHICCQPPQ